MLVSPGLVVETVTIVPGDGYLGQCTFEDWHENLIPDEDDEDSAEIGEHERQYLDAADTVSSFGAVAEGMLRHGRPDKPAMAGTGVDQDDVGPTPPPFWRRTSSARPASTTAPAASISMRLWH